MAGDIASVHKHTADELRALRDILTRENNNITRECGTLIHERDTLAYERNNLIHEHDGLIYGRDDERQENKRLRAENSRLHAENSRLRGELHSRNAYSRRSLSPRRYPDEVPLRGAYSMANPSPHPYHGSPSWEHRFRRSPSPRRYSPSRLMAPPDRPRSSSHYRSRSPPRHQFHGSSYYRTRSPQHVSQSPYPELRPDSRATDWRRNTEYEHRPSSPPRRHAPRSPALSCKEDNTIGAPASSTGSSAPNLAGQTPLKSRSMEASEEQPRVKAEESDEEVPLQRSRRPPGRSGRH